MTTPGPALAGIFRSELQLRLLGEIAMAGDAGLSISDIARRVDGSYSNVHREVERLLGLDMLEDEQVGRTRVMRLSDQVPYAVPLRQMLLMTYGPLPALQRVLEDRSYLVEAVIFGSWARRYAGDPGPPPGDVDVLLVFDPDHPEFPEADTLALFQAVSEANQLVPGANIQATVIPVDEWADGASAFLQDVQEGPLVGLLGDQYAKVLT
jgi:DNA-binding transcriptional ArsR family regulator